MGRQHKFGLHSLPNLWLPVVRRLVFCGADVQRSPRTTEPGMMACFLRLFSQDSQIKAEGLVGFLAPRREPKRQVEYDTVQGIRRQPSAIPAAWPLSSHGHSGLLWTSTCCTQPAPVSSERDTSPPRCLPRCVDREAPAPKPAVQTAPASTLPYEGTTAKAAGHWDPSLHRLSGLCLTPPFPPSWAVTVVLDSSGVSSLSIKFQ